MWGGRGAGVGCRVRPTHHACERVLPTPHLDHANVQCDEYIMQRIAAACVLFARSADGAPTPPFRPPGSCGSMRTCNAMNTSCKGLPQPRQQSNDRSRWSFQIERGLGLWMEDSSNMPQTEKHSSTLRPSTITNSIMHNTTQLIETQIHTYMLALQL